MRITSCGHARSQRLQPLQSSARTSVAKSQMSSRQRRGQTGTQRLHPTQSSWAMTGSHRRLGVAVVAASAHAGCRIE